MSDRENIPSQVKRELRQRCGFGCAICGCPVYEYEHIDGYGRTGHDPEHMTLLCREHHGEKTAGRMPMRQVRAAAANPFNGRKSFTKKHPLYFDGEETLKICLGNLALTVPPGLRDAVGVAVDGMPAIAGTFTDGHLRLDADIRDLDNRLLLKISDGQLRVATTSWDVTWIGQRLTVRSDKGQIVVDMTLDAENGEVEISAGTFTTNHLRFRIGRHALGGGFQAVDNGLVLCNGTLDGGGISLGTPMKGFASVFDRDRVAYAYGAPPAPLGAFRAKTK